jgi:hypothetical protein
MQPAHLADPPLTATPVVSVNPIRELPTTVAPLHCVDSRSFVGTLLPEPAKPSQVKIEPYRPPDVRLGACLDCRQVKPDVKDSRCRGCRKAKVSSRRSREAGSDAEAEPVFVVVNHAPAEPGRCRHCHRAKVNRPRGLCWVCYYAVGIREHYVTDSKFLRRGVGNGAKGVKLPAKPTDAPPGTAEKVKTLTARAAAGVALWHPDDNIDATNSDRVQRAINRLARKRVGDAGRYLRKRADQGFDLMAYLSRAVEDSLVQLAETSPAIVEPGESNAIAAA